MNWNIKDHGESIEQLAASKLDSSIISKYNEYWGKYIGHRAGKPIAIEGIDNAKNRNRLLLGQWCYTLLQNLLFLSPDNSTPFNIKDEEHQKITKSIRLYFEATHLLYNSIEIVRHYSEKYPDRIIDISKFNSFRNFRNIIAHNIRPFLLIDSGVHFPKNYEVFDNTREDFVWTLDTIPNIQYHSIGDLKVFAFEQTKQLLYDIIDKAKEIMKAELGIRTIGEPSESLTASQLPGYKIINTSGSTTY